MTGVGVGVGVLTGIYRVVRGQVRGPDRTGVLTGKVSVVRGQVCGLQYKQRQHQNWVQPGCCG